MLTPETIPVIVGVGEFVDRPASIADSLEPLALMAEALKAADTDAGGGLLPRLGSLDLVGLISWRYADPVAQLCERLNIQPARRSNASMGGETPIRLIHEVAVRIAQGEALVAAVVGGEAMHTRARARKEKAELPWTPQASKEAATQFPSSRFAMSPVAERLGVTDPAQVYPFYEMAAQAAWGQTPAQGQAESAALWARFAAVATQNPNAWIKKAPGAEDIARVDADNRLINWPYPKLMVANPNVNQAAAVIVTSLAIARAAAVAEDRLVYIWGGAEAKEPEDYLKRDRYDRSVAQELVLKRAMALGGGKSFGKLELYSCFPVVPKLAARVLGADPAGIEPTVTGGLTFFGGPLNNYMGHAVCAMVRALRDAPAAPGLLYGQGGYVNKHHALVVSRQAPKERLETSYSLQEQADRLRDPVPELADKYEGPANIETYTVLYGRDGAPLQGVVILRTPDGRRAMGRVMADDEESMSRLLSLERSAVGEPGQLRIDAFGLPTWEAGEAKRKRRPLRFCKVEREGPLTIVTINRPESMNALHPASNAELAEVFNEFATDPEQWVAIITGAGDRAFSSGNDLKFTAMAMARGDSIEPPLTGFAGLTSRFDLNKPVIAAVNGVAMGGGFEIALACDLIIAAETAAFSLPEPKVGLAAVMGGLLRLPAQIGLKQAMGMILTGRRVSAAEGLTLGFVNQVTKPEALMGEARRWAAEIIACSPMSIRASKEIVQRGLEEATLAEASRKQHQYPALKGLFRSADVREGPLAFAQKRAPKWQGK
ncbi:MAG TPA: enoyl-CoA hydratase-related protein [Dehalococcoidia bacterium]|nr:enoyl-CoA hydratase-related protein [Dehalococcoidia bacterium]